MKTKIIVSSVLVFLVLAGLILALKREKKVAIENPDNVVCTMDAKMCPDGSYVGRSGPNCEFKACPVSNVKVGEIAALNERIFNNGVYITPLKVFEDSRCPEDVLCIQAGQVRLQVKIESGSVVKTLNLIEGTGVIVDGKKITLQNVFPATNSKKPISASEYRFTFEVMN